MTHNNCGENMTLWFISSCLGVFYSSVQY